MIHSLQHVLLHMGPGIGMVIIIAWAMGRAGQLSNAKHAAELPLEIAGPPTAREPTRRGRRIPMVALTLAIVLGVGIGIPIAAVVIGARIQATGQQHGGGGYFH